MTIEEIIQQNSGIRLDIGCGGAKQEGFTGLDIRALPGVDIVQDIESFPWPLPDESVIMAVASHLVEHINPHKFGFINFMNEVWRIMKPGGEFAIVTPHANSHGYAQDPTHCNPCNETTFAYFDPFEPTSKGMLWGIYKPKPWRIKFLSWSPAGNIEVIMVKRNSEEVGIKYE